MSDYLPCRDLNGACFARSNGFCGILESTRFKSGECPFKKEMREVSQGKYFPVPTFGKYAKG